MSVKLFCDRCGKECKKHWELRVHTDASCLRPDFTRVLCKSCAADIMSLVNPGTDASVATTGQKAMDREHLIAALKMMQVETGSLVCLGCGHEHNCGVHGCAILREAVEQLEEQHFDASEPLTAEQLRKMHFARVQIVYPPQYEGDPGCCEDGVVLYGKLYSLETLDGAGFEELLSDAMDGETLDSPTGDYQVFRQPAEESTAWIHQLRKPAGGGMWMTREEAIERVTRDLMSAGVNLQTATHLGAPAQYIETIKRETEYLERVALLIRRYWVEVAEVRT